MPATAMPATSVRGSRIRWLSAKRNWTLASSSTPFKVVSVSLEATNDPMPARRSARV